MGIPTEISKENAKGKKGKIKSTRIKYAQKPGHYSQLSLIRRTRALQSSEPRRQRSQHDAQRD